MNKTLPLIALAAAIATACSTKQQAEQTATTSVNIKSGMRRIGNNGVAHLPKAIIYRTTKDYAHNVPVTMDAGRTTITSYPAPQDLRHGEPIALRDGWLLDRRGVGENSVFLDYTYETYTALKATPSIEELAQHIIDKHPIAEMYTLPLTIEEAKADTARCNAIISSGLKDCTAIVRGMARPN